MAVAFEAKVTGGETCQACKGTGRDPNHAWITFRECRICRGHGRYAFTVDISGYAPPHSITELPAGFDIVYDTLKGDPPDRRSPMIKALDGKGWRESLVIADVLADERLWNDGRRPNTYNWFKVASWDWHGQPGRFEFGYDPPSEMIRLLDDPAWRESLKVAETPVEAEYAGVRERLEAMRPAPKGFYSARIGYENEYRQFFGFRS